VFHLWHERHDGIGGHVFLLEQQMRELREELVSQGMVCGKEGGRGMPLHKLETPEDWYIAPIALEEALGVASREPTRMEDGRLWEDFLDFLEGAAEHGGLRVKG
jgi:hypothetical protein